jgi:hypothetical protein
MLAFPTNGGFDVRLQQTKFRVRTRRAVLEFAFSTDNVMFAFPTSGGFDARLQQANFASAPDERF